MVSTDEEYKIVQHSVKLYKAYLEEVCPKTVQSKIILKAILILMTKHRVL
jgi:hypothetical protein